MAFGAGSSANAAATRGNYTPEMQARDKRNADIQNATRAGFTEESAGTTDPVLFRQVQVGPSATERSIASMMRSPGADAMNSKPFEYRSEAIKNPWYKAPDSGEFETTTTVLPGGDAQVVTKRLPERQPAKRPGSAGAAAAGSSSLLSSASGGGLKSLLGE